MIDILNRDDFVKNLVKIVEAIFTGKKHAKYAVTGSWGVGKTFVLDKFEKELESKTDYLIIRYNCWENDYYDEPLIGIVVSVLDKVLTIKGANEGKLEKVKEYLYGILAIGMEKGLYLGNELIKNRFGIDLKKIWDFFKKRKKDKTINDPFSDLKLSINLLNDSIKLLNDEYKFIFIVDELDRCLPDYAIKTLERFHHVLNDIDNVQIIYAIDKDQLKNVIKNIYGELYNANEYLHKYIEFEIPLEEGKINEKFDEKFNLYTRQFSPFEDKEIDAFTQYILSGFDIRYCIQLIDKCHLIHNLLNNKDAKMDKRFMALEIFLIVLNLIPIDYNFALDNFDIFTIFDSKSLSKNNIESFIHSGIKKLEEKYANNETPNRYKYYYIDQYNRTMVFGESFYGYILSAYLRILNKTHENFFPEEDPKYKKEDLIKFKDYAAKFNNLLKSIN